MLNSLLNIKVKSRLPRFSREFLPGKKQLLSTLFIFLSPLLWRGAGGEVSAQNPLVKQWDYRFGGTFDDNLHSVQQTADGGFMLGGFSRSNISGDKTQPKWGNADYWLVKIDSMGIKQWDKDIGGIHWDDLYSMQQTTDGGYILGGASNSDSGGDKSQNSYGGYDYWIVKTDSLGNKLWDKDFGGNDHDYLYSIQQTMDGGYILGGYSSSFISGNKTQNTKGGEDYWIVKTDSQGNKLWDKDFGGNYADCLTSIEQSVDGGFILGGFSASGISGDKTHPLWGTLGLPDYWIVKTDSLGNKVWDKDFGGYGHESLGSVQRTSDGGYILGGFSTSDTNGDKTQNRWGLTDYWIIKIDSMGNKQWDKDFGGTEDETLNNIRQFSDGSYLISGTSWSSISGNKTEDNLGGRQTWIVKTDSLGSLLWDKTLHTDCDIFYYDEIGIAIQTNDGCYLMANYTDGGIAGDKTQPAWNDSWDYWIIKFCDSTLTTNVQSAINNPQSAISIYPNPANELLVISDKRPGKREIEIYDLFGRTVLKSEVRSQNSVTNDFFGETTINISLLSPGIYFVKAGNEVRKFVKE